ncbi:MAG: ROK family protein [Bacteroidetes bacterium]|nr:ROK family protein [Bacteroidota bacterium]
MKIHDAPLRSEDVRQKNEKLILQAIQKSRGLSQSEIVSLTGLKAPTVLRIFTYLEERGLIRITETVDRQLPERKGRKPVFYQVNPTAHYIIGVEFWLCQISIIMTDFQKNLIYRKTIADAEIGKADELVKTLDDLIQQALSESGVPIEKILGIGVGAPGRIDTEQGKAIYYGRIRNMFNLPLREHLEKLFSIPVFINNNAGVVAMNAYRRGSAKNAHALITVLIRSGVGGAFINDGELMLVQGKTAMEIGHAAIDLNGPECFCGAKGCLEAYIAESVVLQDAQQRFPVKDLEELDALAGEGHQGAVALLEEKGTLLGVETRNLFRLFSPDSFLIMTRFPNTSRIYADKVNEALAGDFFCQESTTINVYHDVYDSVEAGRGAADLVFEDYFGMN